jgi:hypothetical protein
LLSIASPTVFEWSELRLAAKAIGKRA